MNRFLPLMIHRVLYLSGAENGSEFRAQRSVRMHIQHMHISIIMFSEMGAYFIVAPPFRIRVALGFTVIIKSNAHFVKYNPKDLQYAQIFVWNSQNLSIRECAVRIAAETGRKKSSPFLPDWISWIPLTHRSERNAAPLPL